MRKSLLALGVVILSACATTEQTNPEPIIEAETTPVVIPDGIMAEEVGIVQPAPVPESYSSVTETVALATGPFSWDEIVALGGSRIPSFNPPATENDYRVDASLFTKSGESDVSLREVHDQIVALIEGENDANYRWRLFSHDSGFVIMTTPERIDDDAKPITVDGQRIGIDEETASGLGGIFARFFGSNRKRFRVLTFTVRQNYQAPGEAFQSGRDVNDLMAIGAFSDEVFKNYLERYYLRHHNFQVLVGIHEFESVATAPARESIWSRYKRIRNPFSLARHVSGSPVVRATYRVGK